MAGRRYTGAGPAAALNVVSKGLYEDLTARRKFDQRLKELGIQVGIKTGQVSPRFTPQGQLSGFQRQDATGTSGGLLSEEAIQKIVESGGTIRHLIKTPQGTITITRGGQKSPKTSYLPEPQSQAVLSGARPGTPLTSDLIPISPAGVNTMNRAIAQGRTESPAAQVMTSSSISGVHPMLRATADAISRLGLGPFLHPNVARNNRSSPLLPSADAGAPADLPDPSAYAEGSLIEDNETGQRFRNLRGRWVPQ